MGDCPNGGGSSVLPLVDVSSSNAATTWPLLLKAIKGADFISLDLELSGLGDKAPARCKSMEEHYQKLCAVVTSRAILSLGVACFKWSNRGFSKTGPVPLEARVFNVWLLTQQPFVTDPSSAQFLILHGFDFNKQYSVGLPYCPPSARTKTTPSPAHPLDALFAHLLHHCVPIVLHNGWLDLLFLYHSFYGALPLSSASLMADLVEMFSVGVYDTKGIAQFKIMEDATYLEYVFRICQHRNLSCRESGGCHGDSGRYVVFECPVQGNPSGSYVERVDIRFPPSQPPEQLLSLQVCARFAEYGFCGKSNCSKSHDVIIAIQQKELQKSNRKRSRARHNKGQKKSKSEEDQQCEVTIETESEPLENTDGKCADMTVLFEKDLVAVRARLSRSGGGGVEGSTGAPGQADRPAGFGHRAGFDAFMTGYAFGCYAVESSHGEVVEAGQELAGLADMRNKLASRVGNWRVPLHILKSHFAKTSSTHAVAQERMRKMLAGGWAADCTV